MPARRTLSTIVRRGQTLESLEAMRAQIAADLEVCDSMRDRAALYLRLEKVIDRIEELRPAEVKGDSVDEIAARRTARRAGAATGSSRAKRPG